MKPQEMWNTYKQINPSIGDEIDAWAFGVEADLLADFEDKDLTKCLTVFVIALRAILRVAVKHS